MGDQWELCTLGYVGGTMIWGTNENCVPRVTWVGGNDMGDQWEQVRKDHTGGLMGDQWDEGPMRLGRKSYTGGLIRWGTNENCVPRVALGDQWDGGPMRAVYPGLRWGTNGMGDQWEQVREGHNGGPMRTVYPGLRWGTNDMGDQWEQVGKGHTGGPMRWGANENCVPRVTLGDQWYGGPMRTVNPGLRWRTSEMGNQWEHVRKGHTGGLMRWGSNDNCVPRVTFGDQWDEGPLITG